MRFHISNEVNIYCISCIGNISLVYNTKNLGLWMQKIYELTELKDITKDLKRKNKVVGLCHGVFDLLHLGHIHYLEEAKSICDYLIVTITDDEFVNKGPEGPFLIRVKDLKHYQALNV